MTSLVLSNDQQKIVGHTDGALLVEAGPGSGKTRVLTERIRRILTEIPGHYRILSLTFTNKAAEEMRDRLKDLGPLSERVFLGTLHSFCMEVLRDRGKHIGFSSEVTIYERQEDRKRILASAAIQEPVLWNCLSSMDGKEKDKTLNYWLGQIGKYKSNPSTIGNWEDPIDSRVYEVYNQALRACGACDFDDILLSCYQLFSAHPRVAEFFCRLYRYLCIDEAQDLNEAQYFVIKALCGESLSNVLMVGDPKQSIYGFSTASPEYMRQFLRDFSAERIELTENFRSSRKIVELSQKILPSERTCVRSPIEGAVFVTNCEDPDDEAAVIVKQMAYLVENGHKDIEGNATYGRCAVLGRNRFTLLAIEQALVEAEIPFYKRLSVLHNNESEEMENFLLALRVVTNPLNRLHLEQLLKRWEVDPKSVDPNAPVLDVVRAAATEDCHEVVLSALDALHSRSRPDLSRAFKILQNYADQLDEEGRLPIYEDISVLKSEWDCYLRQCKGGAATYSGFLTAMALGTTQQPDLDGVALLTVHSSKGLEFDAVFLLGMVEGVFPDYRATSKEELEEERRNFFVAATRSKRLLYLSYFENKMMPWGDMREQEPSQFLVTTGLLS